MSKLLTEITKLSKNGNLDSMLQIETLIENQLKNDPNNTDLLLRLAILEQEVPLADHEKSMLILKEILNNEPDNPFALLLLAYINYCCIMGIDEHLFEKLNSLKTGNNELDSMLLYAAAWFYETKKDEKMLEQLLIGSIAKSQQHVYNQRRLAELYLSQKRFFDANLLIERAINNVTKIYNIDEPLNDITDINEFLDEHIKGIHLTAINYEYLKQLRHNIKSHS